MVLVANVPIEEVIEEFLKKGGRINKYYLRETVRSKHSLVYLDGWFGGANLRVAITKALASK